MEQEQKLKEHHSAESAGGQKVGVEVKIFLTRISIYL